MCRSSMRCCSFSRFKGLTFGEFLREVPWCLLDNFLDCLDCGARILGPLLIGLAMTIVYANTVVYFTYTAPALGATPYSPLRAFCSALGVFILANILYNYWVCVLHDPGRVKGKALREMFILATSYDPAYRLAPPLTAEDLRWCELCNSVKPRRVHHCSVCNACVLKMDHHWCVCY